MWSVIRTILIAFNILAAIAFFGIAGADYGRRQAWSYAVLAHDVAIHGLPLDRNETTGNNEKIVAALGENGIKQLFEGQGEPVATQLEEVERFKKTLDGAIAFSTDKRQQLLTLARILSPLSNTETQRERFLSIQAYLVDAKSADALKAELSKAALAAKDDNRKPFDAAFSEQVQALQGVSRRPFEEAFLVEQKKAPDKKPEDLFEDALEQMRGDLQASYDSTFAGVLSDRITPNGSTNEERKHVIASLLFSLITPVSEIESQKTIPADTAFDIVQGPYRRYLTVVGLAAGVGAIDQQAKVLARMSDELQLQEVRERNDFIKEHQKLVNQQQEGATKEAALGEVLTRQKELLAKQQALVNHRKEDIAVFDANLAKLRQETADRLEEVRKMTDKLYEVRVATRNATEANQKREEKIRTLEQRH